MQINNICNKFNNRRSIYEERPNIFNSKSLMEKFDLEYKEEGKKGNFFSRLFFKKATN